MIVIPFQDIVKHTFIDHEAFCNLLSCIICFCFCSGKRKKYFTFFPFLFAKVLENNFINIIRMMERQLSLDQDLSLRMTLL